MSFTSTLRLELSDVSPDRQQMNEAHSCVSHFPNSLISWPIFEISLGRVVAILGLEGFEENRLGLELKVTIDLSSGTATSTNSPVAVFVCAYFVVTKN
jgi:hypothetical protein